MRERDGIEKQCELCAVRRNERGRKTGKEECEAKVKGSMVKETEMVRREYEWLSEKPRRNK